MIITVKNLQQQTFTITIDSGKTILDLKQQIFEEHGSEYVVDKQKLIYAGIILDDQRTIASYNVTEEKFVVVMLKRDIGGAGHKPDDNKSQETAKEVETDCKEITEDDSDKINQATVSITTTTADEDTKSVDSAGSGGSDNSGNAASGSGNDTVGAVLGAVDSNTSIQSNTSGTSLLSGSSFGSGSGSSETSHSTYSSGDLAGVFSNTSLQSRAESSWLTGEEYVQSVESMIEMGYSRESVERAMAASFNNPERAVEYLISGIPEANEEAFNGDAAAAEAGESIENRDNVGGEDAGGLISGADIEAGAANSDAGVSSDVQLNSAVGTITSSATSSSTSSNTISATSCANTSATTSANASATTSANASATSCANNSATTSANTSATTSANTSATTRNRLNTIYTNSTAAIVNAREDPFEFLRSQPQFLQMRSLVYQNPELLQAVLQQIGQTNPALLRLISENQDAFLSMLNQPMPGQINPQYPRRMTPGRRAQLAAYARAAAGGDGPHVRALDTAPGASGDGPPPRPQPIESGDAGSNPVPQDQLRLDNGAQRRAAAADAFMRERAVAAAAVAALTAAASAAVERNAGGGEGGADAAAAAAHVSHAANEPVSSSMNSGMPVNNINRTNAGNNASVVNSHIDGSGGGEDPEDLGVASGDSIAGITTIRLTTQDRDAIERLKALGFPEALVLQAYFACEKDEQLAANLLISSAFDD